jgi:hypothetical protein
MTVIQRTPDLGLVVHLQRLPEATAAADAATGAGWLLPLASMSFDLADPEHDTDWLAQHVVAQIPPSMDMFDGVPFLLFLRLVGVVAGETVIGITWTWRWDFPDRVDADITVVDGHLRVNVFGARPPPPPAVDHEGGYHVATLTAVAETSGGALGEILLEIVTWGWVPYQG